ncbi:MAG TPA: D-sedoheptulose 7-phosphate isomerase [Polyangiales bacterium]|jgi:D-sedoheptulose 7-phosphate isomerase|nr:D-sedoheptulose 7-phosphate isomerase [Polyangiales bacterium]
MSNSIVQAQLEAHVSALRQTFEKQPTFVDDMVKALRACFRTGNKLLLFGNGGSAADAQHIAAEFVNRFAFDRPALAAIALTTDSSVLTCIGNDSSYDYVFSRQVEALAKPGDVVIAISTSGKSKNVVKAVEAARAQKCVIIGFTGQRGGEIMGPTCDLCLAVQSTDTARIQEVHEFVLHVVSGIVEAEIFPK